MGDPQMQKPSIRTRIIAADTVAAIFAIALIITMTLLGVNSVMLSIGIIMSHTFLASFIAIAGMFAIHPVLNYRAAPWSWGVLLGVEMALFAGFIFWSLAGDDFAESTLFVIHPFLALFIYVNVFAFLAAWAADKYGGSGPETIRYILEAS